MDQIVKFIKDHHISEEEMAHQSGINIRSFRRQIHAQDRLQPHVMRVLAKSQNERIDSIFFQHMKYDPICLEGYTYEQICDIIKLIHPELFDNECRYHKSRYPEYNLATDLGDRIRFIRDVVFSLSQENLAKEFDVSRNTSKYWDVGQINVDKIYQFSLKTNISMDLIIWDNHPLELQTDGMDELLYQAILTNCKLYKVRNKKIVK